MYTLSKGEEIVKSWEYAQVQQGEKKSGLFKQMKVSFEKKTNLTVTNKRLIHTTMSEDSYSRSEFSLAKIKKIEGSCGKNCDPSLLGKAILNFVLACIFIIAGIALRATMIDFFEEMPFVLYIPYAMGALYALFGVINLVRYFHSQASAFMLRIEMDGSSSDGMGLAISSSNFNSNNEANKERNQADVVLVHVDYNAARQILEELGAFVEDAKTIADYSTDEERAA